MRRSLTTFKHSTIITLSASLCCLVGCASGASYGGEPHSLASATRYSPPAPSDVAAAPAPSVSAPAAPSPSSAEPGASDGSWDLVLEDRYQPSSLILTAATVADADRRADYLSYCSRHDAERASLGIDMSRRVRFRVLDARGLPVNNAEIHLTGALSQISGRTHADGVWDFYPSFYGVSPQYSIAAEVWHDHAVTTVAVQTPATGDSAVVTAQLPLLASQSRALDLGFVIDVTGSMEDELRYVNHEVGEIVRRIEAAAPEVRIRVGATLYRDRHDSEPLAVISFTENVEGFAHALNNVSGQGGGDYPEDMNAGLATAFTELDWTEGDAVRVLVLIADAPPQRYSEQFTYREAMSEASRRGIRILPVAASGADRTVEYLFRAMGSFTSTPYVYLTDHSGVGNPHMEADTEWVAVELFNDLLTRMVIADLAGDGMHGPAVQQNGVAMFY